MFSFHQGFTFNFLLCYLICSSQGSEPQCSKFPYEEALLEKMVRMEFKVEQMKDGMKAIEVKVLEELANIREEREKIKSTTESAIEELDADLMKEKLSVTEEKLSELSATLKTLQTKQSEEGKGNPTNIMFVAKDVPESNPTQGKTMVFSTLLENKGRGYDPKTGIFTAPTPGIYLFTVQFCGYENTEFNFAFVQDETDKQAVTITSSKYACSTSTFLAAMDAKSRVGIKCTFTRSGSIFLNDKWRWNSFSGVLVNQ